MAKPKPKTKKATKKKEVVLSAKEFVHAKVMEFKEKLDDEIKAFYQQTGFYITDIEILKEVNSTGNINEVKGIDIGYVKIE